MKTNLKFGTWLITGVNTGFLRHMIEQLLARGGRVAGTVRNGGQAALPGGSLCHASKWRSEGSLDSMAQELERWSG